MRTVSARNKLAKLGVRKMRKSLKVAKVGVVFFPLLQLVWTVLWIKGIFINENTVYFVLLFTNIGLFFHYRWKVKTYYPRMIRIEDKLKKAKKELDQDIKDLEKDNKEFLEMLEEIQKR